MCLSKNKRWIDNDWKLLRQYDKIALSIAFPAIEVVAVADANAVAVVGIIYLQRPGYWFLP